MSFHRNLVLHNHTKTHTLILNLILVLKVPHRQVCFVFCFFFISISNNFSVNIL